MWWRPSSDACFRIVVLVGRLVDAERRDVAVVVGDDVADLPDDLGRVLDDDAFRVAADLAHLVIAALPEVPLDQIPRHDHPPIRPTRPNDTFSL